MSYSKLAKGFTNVTGVKASDFDLYGTIVQNMDDPKDLATYRAGMSFKPYGDEFYADAKLEQDYLASLIGKIGVIFQRSAQGKNALSNFLRGQLPYGQAIQSILYDTVSPKLYQPIYRGPEDSPFRQAIQTPYSRTYQQVIDSTSQTTIIDTVDTKYFHTLEEFHDYIWNRLNSLVSGAVNDVYNFTKLTIASPIADTLDIINNNKSDEPIIKLDTLDGTSKDLAKKIKTYSKLFQYFSRDNNAAGLNQASIIDNIDVIIDVNDTVNLDMDYFGQLFNPENGKPTKVNLVEIDRFPDVWKYPNDHVVTQEDIAGTDGKGKNPYVDRDNFPLGSTIPAGSYARANAPEARKYLNGKDVHAVILDHDAVQVYDQLPMKMAIQYNARNRSSNIFLHKKNIFAFIQGLNAVALIDKGVINPSNPSNGSNGSNSSNGSTASNSSSGSATA